MLTCHFRYLMDLIGKCGVDVTIGLVQTAYANGASTDYIQNVLVSVNPCHRHRYVDKRFHFHYSLESTCSYNINGCQTLTS